MKTVAIALAALTITSGAALAGTGTTLTHVAYACDNDEQLQVVYVNDAKGDSFAIISQMDELIPMKQQVSGSGASYKAISPDYSYVLDTKGAEATLYEKNGDAKIMSCKS